jgi:DNA-binding HxlR family transcriptional regulator
MSPRCRSCRPVPAELRAAAGLLERRWTMATIYACSSGAARFNEFRQSLPGVSPTTLSERLEQLEAAHIVERHLVPGRPPHTEYVLTRHGEQLARAVAGLLENQVADRDQAV